MQIPTLAEIMAMFLRFELRYGWTSGIPEIIQEGCRYKITAVEDDWSFRDSWRDGCFAEAGWSYGHTALSYKDVDLLVIQFQGYYDADTVQRIVIPALNRTFEAEVFYGGRGTSFDTDNLLYQNHVSGIGYSRNGEFFDQFADNPRDPRRIIRFHGRESVEAFCDSPHGKEIGFHRYQGGLMIPESMIRT